MIQPVKLKKILLLDGRGDHYWLEVLRCTVSALDRVLEVVGEAEMNHIQWYDYDLIILDTSVIGNLFSVISQIRSQDPQARIVIFSPVPTWKQARDIMLTGAIDYAPKSLEKENLLSTLKRNLVKRAPSWGIDNYDYKEGG
jgi:DNA-binding NarL/FixJ family response regulator